MRTSPRVSNSQSTSPLPPSLVQQGGHRIRSSSIPVVSAISHQVVVESKREVQPLRHLGNNTSLDIHLERARSYGTCYSDGKFVEADAGSR